MQRLSSNILNEGHKKMKNYKISKGDSDALKRLMKMLNNLHNAFYWIVGAIVGITMISIGIFGCICIHYTEVGMDPFRTIPKWLPSSTGLYTNFMEFSGYTFSIILIIAAFIIWIVIYDKNRRE